MTTTKKQKTSKTKPLALAAVTKPRIRDQIVEAIRHLIVSERMQPGDKLPTESELALRFNVSRLSVREATKTLEFLGILRSKTGVGLIVGELDWQRLTSNLAFHSSLHQISAEQLIDSRVIVETGIVPYVIHNTASDCSIIENLQNLVEKLKTASDIQSRIEYDLLFHRTLLEASRLAPMIAFGEMLQVFFHKFRDSVKKAEWEEAVASHQRIVDALRAKKVNKVISELKQHIESHRHR